MKQLLNIHTLNVIHGRPAPRKRLFVPWLLKQRKRDDAIGDFASDLYRWTSRDERTTFTSPDALLAWLNDQNIWSRMDELLEEAWQEYVGDPLAMLTYEMPEKECGWCEEPVEEIAPSALIFTWSTYPNFSWECATPSYWHSACYAESLSYNQGYWQAEKPDRAERLHVLLSGPMARAWRQSFPVGFYDMLAQQWPRNATAHAGGSVYMIQLLDRPNTIKIGRSIAIDQRLHGLRRQYGPIRLIVCIPHMNPPELERQVHARFAAMRQYDQASPTELFVFSTRAHQHALEVFVQRHQTHRVGALTWTAPSGPPRARKDTRQGHFWSIE